MRGKPRITKPYVIAWHEGGNLVTEGHDDAGAVNERLNSLWSECPHLGPQDRRRPRAFLLEKLHFVFHGRDF